jgi:hypothetical protein
VIFPIFSATIYFIHSPSHSPSLRCNTTYPCAACTYVSNYLLSFASANPILSLSSFLHPMFQSCLLIPFTHPLLTMLYKLFRCSSLFLLSPLLSILSMFFFSTVYNSALKILLLLRWFLASHTHLYKPVSVICRYMFVNSRSPCNPSLKVWWQVCFSASGTTRCFLPRE